MSNFSEDIEYWRFCFGLIIGAFSMIVIYLICNTCHDIATSRDDHPIPTTPPRSC